MTIILPLGRTIILTDAGTEAYSAKLATYDGTPIGLLTLETTLLSSARLVTEIPGGVSLFTGLYQRAAGISARAASLKARRVALTNRIAALES